MSKKGYLSRYFLILNKIRNTRYITLNEIVDYLKYKFENYSLDDDDLRVGISKRTIERDIREIRTLFNIDIDYCRQNKGYYISNDSSENMNFQRMIEAFELFNSLNIAEDLSNHVYPEKRRPLGTEHIYGIIHSIKNRFLIKFKYHKYWEDTPSYREAEPVALKEFRSRWYVMAKDIRDNKIKSFGLDRIYDLEITNHKFKRPENYNINEIYKNCFGIINPDDLKPEKIILSFDPIQGKYVKSFPLHESQEIITENDDELRISLNLKITHDFIMELLSYGAEMKVIAPESLKKELCNVYKEALKLYMSK
ncbi:MAG: WYL domain-containing protein [Bacteroidota bacterium]|nr:WYL domain-containing protein [Bacteroidota bacterium]